MSFLKQYLSIESDNQDVVNESEEVQTSEETEQATEEAAEEQARQEQQEQMEGETVEEAVNIDDSDTPATGGTRLDHYRRLAAERDAEANEEEATPAEEETEGNAEGETEAAEETGENTENTESTEEQTEEENNASEEEKKSEDAEGETETDEADEEDKSKAADSLEALRDEIMISYQKGGMNEAEASIVNTAIESILFSAGVTGVDRIVSSMECFSENSTRRLLATSLTIDNLNMVIDTLRGK